MKVIMIVIVLVALILGAGFGQCIAGGRHFYGTSLPTFNVGGFYYVLYSGYWVHAINVEVSDKEVLTGWHTTSIGASFCEKNLAVEKQKLDPGSSLKGGQK